MSEESSPAANPPRDISSWLVHTLRARRGALTALALLAAFGIGFKTLWNTVGPKIAHSQRYLVTPDSVTITPPPDWVRHPVVERAFQRGQLDQSLSVLDPPEQLEKPLVEAIESDPWVRSIGAIQKSPPNAIALQVEYRSPLAAVVLGKDLMPIDAEAAVLPRGDLPRDVVSWMPRIEFNEYKTRPPGTGEVWAEPRVAGAAAIVAGFGNAWRELDLFSIGVETAPEIRAGRRFWSYKLYSTGKTTIMWGASPIDAPPDESTFAKKLGRLQRLVARYGRLDSEQNSPMLIDLRDGVAEFRQVKLRTEKRLASKPDEEKPVKK